MSGNWNVQLIYNILLINAEAGEAVREKAGNERNKM